MGWIQSYNPLGNAWLSTVVAALPIVILLALIAAFEVRIHRAALAGLASALAVALFVFKMPFSAASATAVYGAAYGLFPIGWIILNLIFLYQLTVNKGHFGVLRSSLAHIAPDPRIQIILIAFSFGAFFEGAAGFGTPVAVTAAILIQLGFKPLLASGLSLIANTAPVAFGALGTPIIALNKVTGLGEQALGAMVGRQLPFFSLIIPFWVVCAFTGFRGMWPIWPAALVAGVFFAVPQYLVSNYHGPWLVDIIASLCSILALLVLLKFWRPREIWRLDGAPATPVEAVKHSRRELVRAWTPWLLLTLLVFVWGLPQVKSFMDSLFVLKIEVPFLHKLVFRVPPVVAARTAEEAIYSLSLLSATGTGILVSAVLSGFLMRYSAGELLRIYGQTVHRVRFSLVTIAAMLSLGYITKYSGTDATLGLALAQTGVLYPFFGTLLGWLGVALTGSDTASNVLFGSLQKITAEQLHLDPVLMAAANSSGGVMGKMIDAQSIVVASTATGYYGREAEILRFLFMHSLVLAMLVGALVFVQSRL